MAESSTKARLREQYRGEIRDQLREKFSLNNPHMIPEIKKITVNMGVGRAVENKQALDKAMVELGQITGQKPRMIRAKRSVANFKLREEMPIACKVDLRGERMYEFLDRVISLAIPRIRDFRGIKRNSFDGRGNFSMGLSEQTVFPEINLDKVEHTQGMDISIVISGGSDEMSFELLKQMGMPFKRD
jgi:large subunit ribosomal protein L5